MPDPWTPEKYEAAAPRPRGSRAGGTGGATETVGVVPDPPVSLRFFISGKPRSTQSGSVIRLKSGRAIPLRRNTPWSAVCGLVARQHAPATPLLGPLRVRLTFQLPAPKSWRGIGFPAVRPDVDGLCKGLLDSWNGVLYRDDGQVCELILVKRYSVANPGVQVEVEPA